MTSPLRTPTVQLAVAAVLCFGLIGCQPDLKISVTADDSYRPGEDIAGSVSVEVENAGGGSARGTDEADKEGYMVDLILSGDDSVPVTFATVPNPYKFQEDMLLRGGRISNTQTLEGGETASYDDAASGVIPSGAPSSVRLCAVVDPGTVISESNEDNNTACVQIAVKSASGARCVTFETQPAGTQYGSPAGHSPGDQIFVQNGIEVHVTDFRYTGGGGTFNVAHVRSSTPAFGVQSRFLQINNLNLQVDFTGLPFVPTIVDFRFRDLGGFENLAINGSPSPVFAGELTSAPSPLGNVAFSTAPRTSISGGYKSSGELSGKVQTLVVGGQEFGIDQICARRDSL